MSATGERDSRRPSRLGRALDAVWTFYAVLGGVGVVALLGVVVVDVLLRYLASSGITGANDMVASWFMVTIAFAGVALAQRAGGRIQVDFVADAVPGRLRQVVDVLVLLAVAGVGVLFAWFGWEEALSKTASGEYAPIGNRPLWPFRFLVPLGFAGFALACLLSAVEVVRRGPSEKPAAEVEYELAKLEREARDAARRGAGKARSI
ncbi:TRAP transporter small permease [Nocardioides sp. SYSU DS0663]|uniref:TRAP transporter small permease n=1 Tax=Nocardioides sp. SYSU DS0663 TaxID=3416445 RepID=UPI003F4B48C3